MCLHVAMLLSLLASFSIQKPCTFSSYTLVSCYYSVCIYIFPSNCPQKKGIKYRTVKNIPTAGSLWKRILQEWACVQVRFLRIAFNPIFNRRSINIFTDRKNTQKQKERTEARFNLSYTLCAYESLFLSVFEKRQIHIQ